MRLLFSIDVMRTVSYKILHLILERSQFYDTLVSSLPLICCINDLFPVQRKLLKDLPTVTKVALYDFPQQLKTKFKLCLCFGNHALQQQHERNDYNMKLNPEKVIFQHRLGSC